MDYHEMHSSIRKLVDALATRSPSMNWPDVVHLLDYGQDDEAMDVIIAMLVRGHAPITTEERETLRVLMDEFDFDDSNRRYYRYLSDTEMLDRMTVVDEPAP